MPTLEVRVKELEREARDFGPLLVFGEPTPEDERAIAEAERIGRPVVRWPVARPRIERSERD